MVQGTTQIYGVIGDPISHSLSPSLHNPAFAALGIDAVYVTFRVSPSSLEDALRGLLALNVQGINVTVPHKSEVFQYVDEVTDTARRIGAINTLRNDSGHWIGENTDATGFIRSLEPLGLSLPGSSVGMLGAGGAAKGVAVGLLEAGVSRLFITNRSYDRATVLAELLKASFGQQSVSAVSLEELEKKELNLLVNTTTVGSEGHSSPAKLNRFDKLGAVTDIIYRPSRTPLLLEAEKLGLPNLNGGGMLLYQGISAFSFWTRRTAPEIIMRKALDEYLSKL
ncbi:MAG: shikimate dehydrogenase [SAR324 cluster bacterium]|uniref:Shikimate dehydrogenase (NADP(+)) n=1 Tax=SAR324 cluster bacterium TaxID=2024889 RepID=A0A2D6YMH0_9DELT|nr:shikimate dehydrogenase [SAR324 cluster bacterium]